MGLDKFRHEHPIEEETKKIEWIYDDCPYCSGCGMVYLEFTGCGFVEACANCRGTGQIRYPKED